MEEGVKERGEGNEEECREEKRGRKKGSKVRLEDGGKCRKEEGVGRTWRRREIGE